MSIVKACLAAAVLMSACLPAQDQPLVLKSTTRLVQGSVIGDDGKGRPAADLKKNDFQIKVSGKVQPISVFALNSATASTRSPALADNHRPLPPHVVTDPHPMYAGAP